MRCYAYVLSQTPLRVAAPPKIRKAALGATNAHNALIEPIPIRAIPSRAAGWREDGGPVEGPQGGHEGTPYDTVSTTLVSYVSHGQS